MFELLISILFLGGLSYGGFLLRNHVKQWFAADEDFSGPGFTLGDLRQLHKSGQLSDVEFETAKAALLQGLGASKK